MTKPGNRIYPILLMPPKIKNWIPRSLICWRKEEKKTFTNQLTSQWFQMWKKDGKNVSVLETLTAWKNFTSFIIDWVTLMKSIQTEPLRKKKIIVIFLMKFSGFLAVTRNFCMFAYWMLNELRYFDEVMNWPKPKRD